MAIQSFLFTNLLNNYTAALLLALNQCGLVEALIDLGAMKADESAGGAEVPQNKIRNDPKLSKLPLCD